jgi:hypothetical protein
MTAFYLPFDIPPPREDRVQQLHQRLAEAQSELLTGPNEKRVQELANEIEGIEWAWNNEEDRK